MNRLFTCISFSVTLFIVSSTMASEIINDNVLVREKPSLKSKSRWKLSKGDSVIILNVGKKESIGKYGTHHWYYIMFSEYFRKGWTFGAFIPVKIFTDQAQLRSSPEAEKGDGNVLKTLEKGSSVTVLKVYREKGMSDFDVPNWYYIELPAGVRGWVFSSDIDCAFF